MIEDKIEIKRYNLDYRLINFRALLLFLKYSTLELLLFFVFFLLALKNYISNSFN